MYKAEEIRHVHLEVSSICNARCPMCLRNVSGGKTNPNLPLKELRLADIEKIFSLSFLSQLKRIYLCGNYGDPILAKDLLPILHYFRRANKGLRLQLFTNGSTKERGFWQELASIGTEIHFGIDGIGETHSLYRRNTDFSTIMANAKSYIDAGGVAHWDYILFRHNEHQVEEAKALSEKMGFRSFRPKKTGRFFSNRSGEVKTKQEVLDSNGNVEYFLEMPTEAHTNSSLIKEKSIIEKFGSFESYLDQTPISCKVAAEKSVFISAEGLVFPCCWTALQLYPWYQKPESGQVWELLKQSGGKESVSAIHHSLETILAGGFFQSIQGSWGKDSLKAGKLKVCSRICGNEFDQFRDQFKPSMKSSPSTTSAASQIAN